jgi:methylmalonyl-CoA mutase, C-terminal domain
MSDVAGVPTPPEIESEMVGMQPTPTRFRVVLAKPGLDGHDRGLKVVAMALRDAGAEVIYLGLRQSTARIAEAAVDEDADVVGVSVLSGAHLDLVGSLLDELGRRGAAGVGMPVVVGGTIPEADAARLRQLGAAAVFPSGTSLDQVVTGTFAAARRHPGGGAPTEQADMALDHVTFGGLTDRGGG